MKNRLAATQTQSQSLNAQVLQSIRLLGLTGLELEQELAEALAHNPMLEREDDEPEAALPDAAPQDRAAQEAAAFDELPEFGGHAATCQRPSAVQATTSGRTCMESSSTSPSPGFGFSDCTRRAAARRASIGAACAAASAGQSRRATRSRLRSIMARASATPASFAGRSWI